MGKKSLLVINSSPNLTKSMSRHLTEYFVESVHKRFPDQYQVIDRDVGKNPVPFLDEKSLEAIVSDTLSTPEAEAAKKLVTQLVDELKSADIIVFGAATHNFMITAELKSYVDHVVRSKMTYEYTSSGPRGLVADKPVLILCSSGGFYRGTVWDHLVPYMKTILAFVGLENVTDIMAEGLAMSASRDTSISKAKAAIDQYIEKL